jgi:hypothetical protein
MASDLIGVVAGDHDWYFNTDNNSDVDMDLYYGLNDKTFVAGNWTGDASGDHPGVVRQGSDGLLHWLLDTNGDPLAEKERKFGLNNMTPVVGDWTGSGKTDLGAVQEGSDGLLHWYLDTKGDIWGDREQSFGLIGMTPLVADWDGDGDDDVGAFWIDGAGQGWILGSTNNDKWADVMIRFGKAGDIPVAGDFDNDGKNDDYGVVSIGNDGLLHWSIDTNRDGKEDRHEVFGVPGHQPIVAAIQHAEVDVEYYANGKWIPIYDESRGVHALTVPTVVRGEQSPSVSIRVHNRGNAGLVVGKPYVSSGFKLVGNSSGTIAPNGSRSFELQLDTSLGGSRKGTLSLTTNDGGEELYNFEVRGEVIAPEITVRDASGRELPDDRSTLAFKDGYRGLVESIQKVRIKNDGKAPLHISSIRTDTDAFRVDAPSNVTLGHNEVLVVTIAMRTNSIGSKRGQLIIVNDDSNENPYNVKLTGRVVEPTPEIEVEYTPTNAPIVSTPIHDGKTAIDLGDRTKDTPLPGITEVQHWFTIRNTGTASLTLMEFSIPRGFNFIGLRPKSVAAGGEVKFRVELDTSTQGVHSGDIVISSNDHNEGKFNFQISGRVTVPEIRVSIEWKNSQESCGNQLQWSSPIQFPRTEL